MTRTVTLFIPCEPKGKAEAKRVWPKGHAHPMAFFPASTVELTRLIQVAYQEAVPGPYPTFGQHVPVSLTLRSWHRRPVSVSQKKRPFHVTKPDGTNIRKLVEDALNHLAFHDDAQIVTCRDGKAYADEHEAGIEIVISEIVAGEGMA